MSDYPVMGRRLKLALIHDIRDKTNSNVDSIISERIADLERKIEASNELGWPELDTPEWSDHTQPAEDEPRET